MIFSKQFLPLASQLKTEAKDGCEDKGDMRTKEAASAAISCGGATACWVGRGPRVVVGVRLVAVERKRMTPSQARDDEIYYVGGAISFCRYTFASCLQNEKKTVG